MRIIDLFDRAAALYPANPAFSDGEHELSYKASAQLTHRIASALRATRGLAKGSKVAVYSHNDVRAFVAVLAVLRADMIWVPLNWRNTVETNIEILSRFRANFIFYHSDFEGQVERIVSALPSISATVCIDRGGGGAPLLEDWMSSPEDRVDPGPEMPDDTVMLLATGGTTGPAKGVEITHRNLETMIANFHAHILFQVGSRHLVAAPMTHAAGVLAMAHFPKGGCNYLLPAADPLTVMRRIQEWRITHVFLPPTALYMLLAHDRVREFDYSSLEHFFVGAAPVSLEKLKEAISVFGPVMTESYGQSETLAIVTCKTPADYLLDDGSISDARLSSAGLPTMFCRVEILDDQGKILPAGERGEIVVRSAQVMKGYFEDPIGTEEVSAFGWHHTGDIGVKDEDGYISIVDRKKDMIITGGFNVFPNEVEQVLTRHPAVRDCAVIGVPDEKWGEAIKGVVELKPGAAVRPEELIALCKEHLGSVKAPKSVEVWDDLPRSANGKVLRRVVREAFWKDAGREI